MANVSWNGEQFVVKVEFWDNERAKGLPKRAWIPQDKVWIAPPTKPNAMYLRKEFEPNEIETKAQQAIDRIDQPLVREPFPKGYPFAFPPKPHQKDALDQVWSLNAAGLFFDMRLGKTYTAITLGHARFENMQIGQMLIICPTPIKSVWRDEFAKFCPSADVFVFESGDNKRAITWMNRTDGGEDFNILIIGVEALSQGTAYNVAKEFTTITETMCVVDESSRIKNFKSARTEKCVDLGGRSHYRLILTGTPITQGLHDLYSQFEFLDANIIGQKSFYTFRNRYVIMGGFEGRQILGYKNAKELMDLTAPYVVQVKKQDVYDYPEMPPQVRSIAPSAEQKRHFAELKHFMKTESEGGDELETKTILERMTRFQQINGGFFPVPYKNDKGGTSWDCVPLKSNPKLNELEQMLPEIGDNKVIIWARFVPEIEAIREMLEKNDKSCVTFYGATDAASRDYNINAFQNGDVQFFVGNQAVGGMGIKLSAADICIYYSNTFSYEDRIQSAARPESMEMTEPVLYIDLVLDTAIDKAIMAAQAKKGGMAEYVSNHMKEMQRELKCS